MDHHSGVSRLDVSVVIPVYNMGPQLRFTLSALCSQTVEPDRYEVIVVDDASPHDVLRESAEVIDRVPRCTTLRRRTGGSAGAARNLGAAQAIGSVLVFLDADCVAAPDLLAAHLAAQHESSVAACGNTFARELTPSAWSLLMGDPWPLHDPVELMARARSDPRLSDDRATELNGRPEDTDWAFFWTQNVSVRRDDFHRVGGFCEQFPGKGVEDMEFALRLRDHGVPTVFLPEAQAFHQPHDRDRLGDLIRDRRNDHLMLRRHPRLEVEAVCSYGIGKARTVWPALRRFAANLDPATIDCAELSSLPAVRDLLRETSRVAVIGAAGSWPTELPPPARIIGPVQPDPGSPDHMPLMGTRLPFDDNTFDLVLITKYWRLLPVPTLCRVLDEAVRCGRRTIMLDSPAEHARGSSAADLAAVLHDAGQPFWEFSFPLRRELHQFHFERFDQAAHMADRALDVRLLPWPVRPFSEVLS
ncbi:glycosyltransferase family 2 protein [Actinocrispum wychmicini]|uniref:GT2 family glycosyltransferase n=1 Tax=Actinocrispum wychmicini TaxID=1213861 RepID=A0A4R2JQ54_9PSEU|nr:glycosyltransferase family 2 protein [Actinocrispum wychmicini]TCO61147.1 GT2 family glycosyltransferase [Actinocrispum wychmicini]